MQSDMHNLFPSIGEVNGDRSNFVFGEIDGEEREYGECDFEVAERIAEPKKSIRGDIARSYFYMSHQYKMEISEDYGYKEINLNLGCPSKKVQKNKFGACLIKEPDLVAECINSMVKACNIPVTAKTRIGFDDTEEFDYLNKFIHKMRDAGSKTFILHARKAILTGLSPKQNLNIPKLNYEMVYDIKKENPNLEIIINGGITKVDEINNHLKLCDGVMIGRSIYQNPYSLIEIEKEIFKTKNSPTREQVVERLLEYAHREVKLGTKINHIMRHTVGLYHGQVGSKEWKRYLSDNMMARDSDFQKAKHIMTIVQNNEKAIQANS